ncbi:MAG: hypothetical protein U1F43_36050 [Myxococcota bacterium]
MANGKKGGIDDGVVTSAPSASVNSLLTDLLSEAKKGVEEERKQVDNAVEKKENAAKEVLAREESRKREEAQQKLIEENRRRNEALARRDRVEGEKKVLSTAPHMRPIVEGPVAAAIAEAPKAPPKRLSSVVMAALVVVGAALGVGGAFALQPEARGAFLDVDVAARALVAQTAKAAAVEKRVGDELAKARDNLSQLEKSLGGAGVDAKQLQSDLAAAKADLAKTQAELTALREATANPVKKPTGGHRPTGGGLPTLNGSVFK